MLENPKPPINAEITAQTPLPHDDAGKNQPAGENSLFEKLRTAAGNVFDRHGVKFKPGRGRPRKDGAPKASDVPLNAPASALPAAVAAVPAVDSPALDSALVRRCISAVTKGFFGFADKILHGKIIQKTGDAKFAGDVIKDCAITQDELNGLAELSEICLRKYGVGTQYAPEIGLGAIVIGIGARYAVAFAATKPEKTEDAK